MVNDQPLWMPKDSGCDTPMGEFAKFASHTSGRPLGSFNELHEWSIAENESFWSLVWERCRIIGHRGTRTLDDSDTMLEARFFPDALLNYAENLLQYEGGGDALVFWGEDKVKRRCSWDELRGEVSRLQQAFIGLGIGQGDRIAAMMPNVPETIACMLAAASIGAIWSSCSPDFGEQGVVDRFGQISPKLFIVCDGYWYGGRWHDVSQKAEAVRRRLNVPMIVVAYENIESTINHGYPPYVFNYVELKARYEGKRPVFQPLPFSHPLFILFSSGTTGVPKCIIHSAGGTLLQHAKEHHLHCGIKNGDRLFYYTTCGWMMWNWLASGLASGATLCLYDGSPFSPSELILFDYAETEQFHIFGTSAKYIETLRKSGNAPLTSHNLDKLRLITSTGSPLSREGFSFVYSGIKNDVLLASIAGGTDIISCFVLGNPMQPVWCGEIQGPGLGMAIEIWNETGRSVRGEKGELVCTKAFPSMPLGFWNDPDGTRYRATYFNRFENVWCHGDFAELTIHDGIVIHGRSDATLNPGGVRIGTAEIYNLVENLSEVEEAICIGQAWEDDVRVVLFVKLTPGAVLDPELKKSIKMAIKTGASPRHVPAKIVAVNDIPRTKSGKIVELAVRDVVHRKPVRNTEALANPESLKLFENIPDLQT
jgi:acetoacetyl-CoA synthetase